eukprot:PhM_4_TR6813/c0_g1_i1/m.8569
MLCCRGSSRDSLWCCQGVLGSGTRSARATSATSLRTCRGAVPLMSTVGGMWFLRKSSYCRRWHRHRHRLAKKERALEMVRHPLGQLHNMMTAVDISTAGFIVTDASSWGRILRAMVLSSAQNKWTLSSVPKHLVLSMCDLVMTSATPHNARCDGHFLPPLYQKPVNDDGSHVNPHMHRRPYPLTGRVRPRADSNLTAEGICVDEVHVTKKVYDDVERYVAKKGLARDCSSTVCWECPVTVPAPGPYAHSDSLVERLFKAIDLPRSLLDAPPFDGNAFARDMTGGLRDATPDKFPGRMPWIQHPDDTNLPYTHYAQWVLARSQLKPDRESCRSVNLLMQPLMNFGLGADIEMASWALIHAVATRRLLVFERNWRRWTLGGECPYGTAWECYYMAPSECSIQDIVNVEYGDSSYKGGHTARHERARVIRKLNANTRDLGLHTRVNLLPPNVTRADVERLSGLPYYRWMLAQAMRYLTRYVQPWVHVMVEAQLEPARYPWRRPMLHTHLRGGDPGKVVENRNYFRCGVFHFELQAVFADEMTSSWNRSSIFASFDQPQMLRWLKQSRGGDSGVEILDAGFEWPSEFKGEARAEMIRRRGRGHMLRVSFTNLYLAVHATAWASNDLSVWTRLIDSMRRTSGRAHCPMLSMMDAYITDIDAIRAFCVSPGSITVDGEPYEGFDEHPCPQRLESQRIYEEAAKKSGRRKGKTQNETRRQ